MSAEITRGTDIDPIVERLEDQIGSARMASRAICGRPDHIYGAFGSITRIVNSV